MEHSSTSWCRWLQRCRGRGRLCFPVIKKQKEDSEISESSFIFDLEDQVSLLPTDLNSGLVPPPLVAFELWCILLAGAGDFTIAV